MSVKRFFFRTIDRCFAGGEKMDLSKIRQLLSRKPPQPPDHLLNHAERELDHREQLIREKHQAVEEKLRSLHEANQRLKE
jgi:DNA-binding transcriptional MerR regulator